MVCSVAGLSQKADIQKSILSGNQFYADQKFAAASQQYLNALVADPHNPVARFNQANALFKQDKKVEAAQIYSDLAINAGERELKSKTWYNKGVVLTYEKNIEGSVVAYENALRNNPEDKEARENLQKALLELKKKKEEKKKPDQQQQKNKEQEQKQNQSKMQPKEADQRLRLLEQKEKQVQERVQKQKTKTGVSQIKDW